MRRGMAVVALVVIGILALFGYTSVTNNTVPTESPDAVRYVALGDSYTIGFDVAENEAWPSILVDRLQADGIAIELIDNLAVIGYTAQDVITFQLPEYQNLNPQFATILIGANDISLGIDEATFRRQFSEILDGMLHKLEDKTQLVVLTIPDFTNTPRGRVDFSDEKFRRILAQYNSIIKEEANKRNLPLVDLQNINEGIDTDDSYYTADGLHPTGKQYKLWSERIYPKVKEIIQQL